MKFTPYPGTIQVQPAEQKGPLRDASKKEVNGKVLAVGEGVTFFKPGDVACYLAWGLDLNEIDGTTYYTVRDSREFIMGKLTDGQ